MVVQRPFWSSKVFNLGIAIQRFGIFPSEVFKFAFPIIAWILPTGMAFPVCRFPLCFFAFFNFDGQAFYLQVLFSELLSLFITQELSRPDSRQIWSKVIWESFGMSNVKEFNHFKLVLLKSASACIHMARWKRGLETGPDWPNICRCGRGITILDRCLLGWSHYSRLSKREHIKPAMQMWGWERSQLGGDQQANCLSTNVLQAALSEHMES